MDRAMHYSWANASYCTVCGRRLDVHEAAVGQVCRDVRCRSTRAHRDAETHARRRVSMIERSLKASRQYLLGTHSIDAREPLAMAQVPAVVGKPGNLAEERRRRFRDNLGGIVSRAAALRAAGKSAESGFPRFEERAMSASEAGLLGQACATCRGMCCHAGQQHAFIDETLILRFMRDNPALRPRQVLDAYLSRIGTRTYTRSCVYHGVRGCTLPRSMRSDVCNRFLCNGLRRLLCQLQSAKPGRALVLAATETHPARAAILYAHSRQECDASDWVSEDAGTPPSA